MKTHYGEIYHKVISSVGEANAVERWRRQRKVVAELKEGGGALLDVGCSSGSFLSTLKGGPWTLYGIEIDPEQAKRAKEKTEGQIFAGDLLDAPFAPETFHIVTCFHVLEHFDRPKERIARIIDWLKPGGIVYLGLPNISSWEARLFGSYWFGLELPRHFYHYSPKSLRQLLLSAGLREIWLRTPGFYAMHSFRYVLDDVQQRLDFSRRAIVGDKVPVISETITYKIIGASLKLTVGKAAELVGAGPNIEAVFRKE